MVRPVDTVESRIDDDGKSCVHVEKPYYFLGFPSGIDVKAWDSALFDCFDSPFYHLGVDGLSRGEAIVR